MRAGGRFQARNPTRAPASPSPTAVAAPPSVANPSAAMAPTPAARPSWPSRRLTAFNNPSVSAPVAIRASGGPGTVPAAMAAIPTSAVMRAGTGRGRRSSTSPSPRARATGMTIQAWPDTIGPIRAARNTARPPRYATGTRWVLSAPGRSTIPYASANRRTPGVRTRLAARPTVSATMPSTPSPPTPAPRGPRSGSH